MHDGHDDDDDDDDDDDHDVVVVMMEEEEEQEVVVVVVVVGNAIRPMLHKEAAFGLNLSKTFIELGFLARSCDSIPSFDPTALMRVDLLWQKNRTASPASSWL